MLIIVCVVVMIWFDLVVFFGLRGLFGLKFCWIFFGWCIVIIVSFCFIVIVVSGLRFCLMYLELLRLFIKNEGIGFRISKLIGYVLVIFLSFLSICYLLNEVLLKVRRWLGLICLLMVRNWGIIDVWKLFLELMKVVVIGFLFLKWLILVEVFVVKVSISVVFL